MIVGTFVDVHDGLDGCSNSGDRSALKVYTANAQHARTNGGLVWEVIVGIEVHAQIKSRRKLFSGQYAVYLGTRPPTFPVVDASFVEQTR